MKYGLIRDAAASSTGWSRTGAAVLAGDAAARARGDPPLAGDQGRDRRRGRARDRRASGRCSISATPSPMPTRRWRATTAGCCTARRSAVGMVQGLRALGAGWATARPRTWSARVRHLRGARACRPGSAEVDQPRRSRRRAAGRHGPRQEGRGCAAAVRPAAAASAMPSSRATCRRRPCAQVLAEDG